jgi:hypothetical protein
MPAKKTTTKTSTKKVTDITEMEDSSPASSPKAAVAPVAAPHVGTVTNETLYKEISELKAQVSELLLVVSSLSNSLIAPATDLTKVAPKKPKVETTFNWFKSRVQKDNALLEAILKGNNPDLWAFGEYKTKFRGNVSQVTANETDEVRKKAAHTLWVKCFGKEEQEYIKNYRNKVDPPEVPTKSKKKKCTLFSEDEEDDNVKTAGSAAEPATAATKPAKKPAAKSAKPAPAPKGKKIIPPPSTPELNIEDEKSHDSDSQGAADDDESD